MRSASLAELKRELRALPSDEVLELCARLAKYKRDNKELLNYLIFESLDEDAYVEAVKEDIASAFDATNTTSFYLAKKSIRRALRIVNKYAGYSGHPDTELELLIFFCEKLRNIEVGLGRSKVLLNLYSRQLQRIGKIFSTLHEDLRYDLADRVNDLKNPIG